MCIFEIKIYSLIFLELIFNVIDYFIFDQTRQSWINLEFYFERYESLIFRDFLGIFFNFYEFHSIYFELK